MDWITAKQASLKWQIPTRTVQYLCKSGRVKGAKHFNGVWAIPFDAPEPDPKNQMQSPICPIPEKPVANPQLLTASDLKAILDQCPYALTVSRSDGLMLYANAKFMAGVMEDVRESAVGNYNILKDPGLKSMGIEKHVHQAFSGQQVTTGMLPSSRKDQVGTRYEKDQAFAAGFHSLTSYPVFDAVGNQTHVVSILVPEIDSVGRNETLLAKEYIDHHWLEPFSAKDIAKAVNLSISRLSAIFKSETGFTLHDYYIDVKIKHICRTLLANEQAVSDVFTACGASYNSHYTKIFRSVTGLTPRQYRQHKKHNP